MGPCGWEPLCSGYARQAAARRLQACCDWMFEILHHTVLIPGEDVDTSYITCMGVSWRVLVCIMQAGLASATQRCGWACLSSCVAVTACHPKPTLHPTPESELTVSHCVAGSDSPTASHQSLLCRSPPGLLLPTALMQQMSTPHAAVYHQLGDCR